MTDPLGAALDTLLQPGRGAGVLATPSALEAAGWPATAARVVTEREVPTALRRREVRVLLLHRVTMTIVRALGSHPVPLVVLTADRTASRLEAIEAIEGVTVLGPQARLRTGDGSTLVCASDPGELEGLLRALGGAKLAACPTPSWWWRVLDRKAARGHPAAGYVPAAALHEAWARWQGATDRSDVLVPLGVPAAPLDEPGAPSLAAVVAAHALERHTGPVFPAPRVIAAVLEGLGGSATASQSSSPASSSGPAPGLWQQARRALPMTGSMVGMEQARPALAEHVATAAFLAQRVLLRAEAATHARTLALEPPTLDDDDGQQRAHEVLASAGQVLTDHESKVVLRGFGIEVTRQAVASSASGASGFADRIGFPVALKALSPDLRRRAEIGAMQLDLPTAAAVRRAYAAIVEAVEQHAPTARLDGVLVAEMVEPGLDLHCGAIALPSADDGTAGGLALFGRAVEGPFPVEPVLALSPLSTEDALLLAHAIVSRVPVPALRRASDPDIEDLATLLLQLDALVRAHDDRLELVELRPVRLVGGERGYVTLDARIVQRAHLQGR